MPHKDPEVRRECWRKSNKAYYEKNKAARLAANKARLAEVQRKLQEYKKTLACERCGERYYRCLQFHHTDSTQKVVDVSLAASQKGWSFERILTEIAKCQCLCANCHVRAHFPEDDDMVPVAQSARATPCDGEG